MSESEKKARRFLWRSQQFATIFWYKMFALLMLRWQIWASLRDTTYRVVLANRRRRIKRSYNLSSLIYSVYRTRKIFHCSPSRLEAAKLFLIPFVIKFIISWMAKAKQTPWGNEIIHYKSINIDILRRTIFEKFPQQ